MVDPARHTGLPERTLGELSETSLGKKYLIQTRTRDCQDCRIDYHILSGGKRASYEIGFNLICLKSGNAVAAKYCRV